MLHHPVRSPGGNPAPGVSATPPKTDAASRPCPPPGGPRATFRDLPGHIVLQIAERVDDTAAMALGLTSKHAHQALDHARITPVRLGEQMQWIVSHADVQRLRGRIEQCPVPARPRLWNGLHCAVRRHCPDPLYHFYCTSGSPCSVPLHPVVRERALASLPPLPPAAPRKAPQALDELLTLGDAERGPSLVAWIAHAGRDTMMEPGLAAWLDIVARLPPNDRVAVQAMVTEHCDDRDVAPWRAMLDATLCDARARQDDADPSIQLQRVRSLNAVAKAVARRHRSRDSAAHRWGFWAEVLADTQQLPDPHYKTLLHSLAYGAFHGCACLGEPVPVDDPVIKGWRALIKSALTRLSPVEAANVLSSMLEPLEEFDVQGPCAPLLDEVFAATRALPHGVAIGVLKHAFDAACRNGDEVIPLVFWDRLLHACKGADPALQAECLATLAGMCPHIGDDGMEARLVALCEQVEALSPELRREPLWSLARNSHHFHGLVGMVVPRWMALCNGLGDEDRARLLASMIYSVFHDGHWRRGLINTAASLAAPHRYGPLCTIARELFKWAEGAPCTLRNADVRIAASPDDYAIARLPTSWEALMDQLSQILVMLPLRQRGDLLLDLEHTAKTAVCKAWILEKAKGLPPTQRHEVKIITRIAEYAATNCPEEHASMLLPLVAEAVATLDDGHRASALYWLIDACTKFGLPACVEIGGTIDRLPEPDRLTPNAGHKRKASRDAQADV
ncbi:hypothetical protein J5T34_09535 [Cupriavidus gilardii]|uniref:hypothetical protein n=1 Tax=Cupriavidus gilardii TaxID=82541 RepID=UPI001ABE8809|nr:hypothetical protein [Cupriavidus gilardii]MBO4120971.1 hypothetical protein [Cupriavidus gilardii]